MTDNIYAAPEAELSNPLEQETFNEFYVVSIKKFYVLFIFTAGLYSIYWFYKHFQFNRIKNNLNTKPVLRAIFNVFFTHNLFTQLELARKRQAIQTPRYWHPMAFATLYVVSVIAVRIIDRVANSTETFGLLDFAFIPVLFIQAWLIGQAQNVANTVCEQPSGASNSAFTAANWIWIALGTIFWLLITVVGAFMPTDGL